MPTYDPHKSKTDVRQANPRKMNFRVLAFSLIAVIVIFAVIFIVYTNMHPAQV